MDKSFYELLEQEYWEKVLEIKKCKICGDEFVIFEKDKKLLDKISPKIWWEKIDLLLPDECPKCRQIQRLIFRNENNLYKVKSSVSWKPLISVFSPDLWLNIYSFDEFYNSNEFSKEIEIWSDLNENLKNLLHKLPQLHLQNWPIMENSEYNNLSWRLKNCYLCYDCWWIENALYCWFIWPWSHDIVDCFDWARLQNSYEVTWASDMNKSYYCNAVDNCFECYFCENASNLSYCIWCKDVNNKEYYIFNKSVSKEDFEQFKAKYFNWSYSWLQEFLKLYNDFRNNIESIPNSVNYNTENVVWEHMVSAKNIFWWWFTYRSEDSRYTYFCDDVTDCMDTDFCVNNMQLCYQCITSYNCYNSISCLNLSDSKNCYYCISCSWCSDCFWCYWLTNQQYCIFNKQYTKEEYEQMVQEIIKNLVKEWKWGNFLDSSLSLFPYNDTCANNLYPIEKSKDISWKISTINKDWTWTVMILEDKFISRAQLDLWWEKKLNILFRTKDQEINVPTWIQSISIEEIPDKIDEIDDQILNKWIVCEETWRIFRVTKTELDFYKKHKIPFPRKHFWFRQIERARNRPSGRLFVVQCAGCGKKVFSIHDSNSKTRILCLDCFERD